MTPVLDLALGFVLAGPHRHVSTNEPGATRGPTFMLVRSAQDNVASRAVARRLGLVMDARSFTVGNE